MNINPDLLEAISRNEEWIQKKCKVSEMNLEKCKELLQEVILNLYTSNKSYIKNNIESPDAWVKKITTNVTATYISKAMVDKNTVSIEYNPVSIPFKSNTQHTHDLDVLIHYIKTELKLRDREMMLLYILKEPQSSIAEIVGMEVKSVTNRISILKKQLSDYLNKGLESGN
jgi:DNA-directed RNA polymerase specialized sigma24 family protein